MKKILLVTMTITILFITGCKNSNKEEIELKKAINTYYDYDLHNLNGKILLIYGNKDKQTPFKEGKRIKKINNDIELVKIKGDHFVLINANFQISKLIYKFVREDI